MCYPTIQSLMDYDKNRFLNMSYSEQRRERLNDVIFDYISDEETSMEELFDDIIAEVRGSHEYFARYEQKCSRLLEKFNAVRDADDADWEDFWNSEEETSSEDC
jgi:LPS O-antigen subunit length determinant protein (WzzB/FepE family)